MEFTEEDLAEQSGAVAALRKELDLLDAYYGALLETAGFTEDELRKAVEGEQPPEVKEAMEKSVEAARRAGAARAAARVSGGKKSGAKKGREGALRV
ncbi:MAG: hypothetical protein LBD42_05685 [Desulfovibrio sp.]|nr:hypothetical protein [Desulfovibrio sp.]